MAGKNNPKISFFGGTKEVDGACYLIEVGKVKILVEAGLHQSSGERKRNATPFPFDPRSLSAAVITHAHIDHIGLLPRLYKEGFRGKVYSTPPTKEFAKVMLEDSQSLLASEKEPLYSMDDVEGIIGAWETVEYHREKELFPEASFTFFNAGHILGSVIAILRLKPSSKREVKLVFSGDLGNPENMLFPQTEKISEGDYCLIESAYGNRLHENLEKRKDIFEDIIEETIRRGGVLMIPAFAMERTQELLFELNELVQAGRIPRVPVFVDSPLALKITDVHRQFQTYFRLEAFKLVDNDPDGFFNFPGLKFTLTTEESKAINDVPAPKIIVAGSGSSQGGRILHHEKRYLPDPKSALLMVGYQMRGTLGRRILEGEKNIKIHGEEIAVRARVEQIGAYSAHADQRQLLDWIKPMRFFLKKVFVVQGEEEASQTLAQKMRDDFGLDAVLPEFGQTFELETREV